MRVAPAHVARLSACPRETASSLCPAQRLLLKCVSLSHIYLALPVYTVKQNRQKKFTTFHHHLHVNFNKMKTITKAKDQRKCFAFYLYLKLLLGKRQAGNS